MGKDGQEVGRVNTFRLMRMVSTRRRAEGKNEGMENTQKWNVGKEQATHQFTCMHIPLLD